MVVYNSMKENNCEHKYELYLPSYGVKTNENYKGNPELYYKIMDEIEVHKIYKIKKLSMKGIIVNYYSDGKKTRIYKCVKCNKKTYEYTTNTRTHRNN